METKTKQRVEREIIKIDIIILNLTCCKCHNEWSDFLEKISNEKI